MNDGGTLARKVLPSDVWGEQKLQTSFAAMVRFHIVALVGVCLVAAVALVLAIVGTANHSDTKAKLTALQQQIQVATADVAKLDSGNTLQLNNVSVESLQLQGWEIKVDNSGNLRFENTDQVKIVTNSAGNETAASGGKKVIVPNLDTIADLTAYNVTGTGAVSFPNAAVQAYAFTGDIFGSAGTRTTQFTSPVLFKDDVTVDGTLTGTLTAP